MRHTRIRTLRFASFFNPLTNNKGKSCPVCPVFPRALSCEQQNNLNKISLYAPYAYTRLAPCFLFINLLTNNNRKKLFSCSGGFGRIAIPVRYRDVETIIPRADTIFYRSERSDFLRGYIIRFSSCCNERYIQNTIIYQTPYQNVQGLKDGQRGTKVL